MRKYARLAALMLCVMLLLQGFALAAAEITPTMQVTPDTDWVSLRSQPKTNSSRLAKVPAGAYVTACEKANKEFVCCVYEGQQGYILTRYLLPVYGSVSDETVYTDTSTLGTLRVTGCDDWVSLRKKASTSSDRLCKVPAGALVTGCEEADNGFISCAYNGQRGYILAEYLEKADAEAQQTLRTAAPAADASQDTLPADITAPAEEMPDICKDGIFSYVEISSGGRVELDAHLGTGDSACYVFAVRKTDKDSETLYIGGYDLNYFPLWGKTMTAPQVSGEQSLSVFSGGTESKPILYLYHAGEGLLAADPLTGDTLWVLPSRKLDLGISVCQASDSDGTLYIAGKHGPHPVAINANGGVLWMSDIEQAEVYGPYRITVTENGISTDYESTDAAGSRQHYRADIDFYGTVTNVYVTNIR